MQITEKTKEMARCLGHKIKVSLTTGDEFEGECICFTQPFDNEPEIADFSIQMEKYGGAICITEPEIDEITIID